MDVYLNGTKEVIFDSTIQLTHQQGFENVSVRDIAKKSGIKAPSIYNHYANKEQILHKIYDYYVFHMEDNRLLKEEMMKIIATGTADEIVHGFSFTFAGPDQKKYQRMILITKIVYMRIFQDDKAHRIFLEVTEDQLRYVREMLQYGIGIGRIRKELNVPTFADLLINSRQFMGLMAFAKPGYKVGQLAEEDGILAMLTEFLSQYMIQAV